MGFTIEQSCPQCGAPVDLDETDHLLQCPFCDVKSFLFTPNYFRYLLPHNASEKDIIFMPYLRFKGNVYYCKDMSISHRVVDISQAGLDLKGIPLSLGLRPQAMKLNFVKPETEGSFLRFSLKAADILMKAGKLPSGTSSGQVQHRAFIGETMSLIYLPMYVEGNRLFDGILNRPVSDLPDGPEGLEPSLLKNPRWDIAFIPTICPQCGWNMEGERDSVVMLCKNCHSAWEALEGKFVRISHSIALDESGKCIFLPFWKISAYTKVVEIGSFSDFIRITNQPRIVDDDRGKEDMSFWSPAFKIRPKLFLNLSRQFTISQSSFDAGEQIPETGFFPVTLPRTEAVQALKIILANSTVNKRNIFPYLPRISFEIKDTTLFYLPFTDTGHDMIQADTGISINKQSLDFGRKL